MIYNALIPGSIYIYILVSKYSILSLYICNIDSPSKHLKSTLPWKSFFYPSSYLYPYLVAAHYSPQLQ